MNKTGLIQYLRILFFILSALYLYSGCDISKKTVTGKRVVSEDENLVRKVYNSSPDWKFVDIRFTGKAEEDEEKIGFIGSIKIVRKQEIFIVLRTTIGIELARVFINRDSIWMVSKMLGIKEKFDWNQARVKLAYPLDFDAVQGIFVQSLFTSSGEHIEKLVENLVVRSNVNYLQLVSRTDMNGSGMVIKYYNDFTINRDNYVIDGVKIRDINGQWITDINYLYNNDNHIKKIQIKGIDTARNYTVDINVVKMEFTNISGIDFDKF